MDKLATYRQLIKQLLTEHADLINQTTSGGAEAHLIFDEERDHYMLFSTGWWNKSRIHTPTLYLRLHQGKIWIEEDWTEDGIAVNLLSAGVAKDDIVLAFHPPEIRPYTEFAVT
jgi:hypothetical protein